ncbi:MAG: hypothetical protein JSU82_07825 [Rhodospirillales bacterium]|nr:MAG: hypothetical protein JSU82_07825 [Rhodospirillales bacterium]
MTRAFLVESLLICGIALAIPGSSAVALASPGLRSPPPTELAQLEWPDAVPPPLPPEAGPRPLEAPPPAGPLTPDAAGPDADTPETGIEILELRAVDPDSGGLLEPSMGGLGINIWEGTSRAMLLRLLPQLPNRYDSPTLHDLARRLLLSTAIIPPRSQAEPAGGVMAARIKKLEAMGLSGGVAGMLDLVPEGGLDAELMRVLADSRLLSRDDEGACAAAAAADGPPAGTYWEQLLVFCQARAGDGAAANFGLNLLSESEKLDDPAFFSMTGALLTGGEASIESLPQPTPLHLALARATGTPLPADVLDDPPLPVLRALVDETAAPEAVRLEAAEMAVQAGILGAARLADLYNAIEVADDEIARALTLAEEDHSPRHRGLVLQAAMSHELPVGKAAAMQKAWQLAAEDGFLRLSVAVYLPMLEDLPPGALTWFAADAVRAFYAFGRFDKAAPWLAAAGRIPDEPEYMERAALLWPLVALVEGSARAPGHDAWLAALRARDGADAALHAGLAYSLFEAMGERVREEDWLALLDGVSRAPALAADPAYLRQFRGAATAGRKGETALLALLILGRGGVADTGPGLMSEIIIGLRMVGLEEEARRLALEAALEGGL